MPTAAELRALFHVQEVRRNVERHPMTFMGIGDVSPHVVETQHTVTTEVIATLDYDALWHLAGVRETLRIGQEREFIDWALRDILFAEPGARWEFEQNIMYRHYVIKFRLDERRGVVVYGERSACIEPLAKEPQPPSASPTVQATVQPVAKRPPRKLWGVD